MRKLQNKLNVKLPAKLGVDGAFGEKTARALQEFQTDLGNPPAQTVDEDTANVLLDRTRKREGPDVDPPGPKPNGVDLGPLMFNTTLDATFDEIVEQYGAMLSNQGDALNEFRTDLANPESKQPGLVGTLLTEGANFVIDGTLGDAETSLKRIATTTAQSVLEALPSATPDDGPDLTIGQLGFPVRIQGSEGGGLFSSSTEIAIEAPEDRRSPEKVNKGNTSADEYLKLKGADGAALPDEMLQVQGHGQDRAGGR